MRQSQFGQRIWNSISGGRHSSCKGPGAGPGLVPLEEQRGGPRVWSRVSEGERGRKGGQGGDGAGRAGPCGRWGGLGLLPQGGGSPGGLWAEEGGGPASGAHLHPLVVIMGRTDCGDQGGSWGIRAEGIVLVQAHNIMTVSG